MSNTYYRGTNLGAALDAELRTGRVEGFTATMYRGRLEPHVTANMVQNWHPLDTLDWWTPEGVDDKGYIAEEQGVTGGLTEFLGTAVNFANQFPVVFYIDGSDLRTSPAPVRYNRRWFDGFPGGLAWVSGGKVEGEIRTENDGLIGLTVSEADEPVVYTFGTEELRMDAMAYEDERETLVFRDHIDLGNCCRALMLPFEGTRTPRQVLSSTDGYHAGWGDEDEVDITRWADAEVLAELHDMVRSRAQVSVPPIYSVGIETRLMEKVRDIPLNDVAWVYDGTEVVEDLSRVPDWLFGPGGGM